MKTTKDTLTAGGARGTSLVNESQVNETGEIFLGVGTDLYLNFNIIINKVFTGI